MKLDSLELPLTISQLIRKEPWVTYTDANNLKAIFMVFKVSIASFINFFQVVAFCFQLSHLNYYQVTNSILMSQPLNED